MPAAVGTPLTILPGGRDLPRHILTVELAEPPAGLLAELSFATVARFEAIALRLHGLDALLQLAKCADELDPQVRWVLSAIQDSLDACLALAALRADEAAPPIGEFS